MSDWKLNARIAQLEAALAAAEKSTIPPAVREAAMRLHDWFNGKDIHHPWYKLRPAEINEAKLNDILLICQHVLGREQG